MFTKQWSPATPRSMWTTVPARTAATASSTRVEAEVAGEVVQRPGGHGDERDVPVGGDHRDGAEGAVAARRADREELVGARGGRRGRPPGRAPPPRRPGSPSRSASVGAAVQVGPDDGFTTIRTPVPSADGRASGSGRRRGIGNPALARSGREHDACAPTPPPPPRRRPGRAAAATAETATRPPRRWPRRRGSLLSAVLTRRASPAGRPATRARGRRPSPSPSRWRPPPPGSARSG